MNEIRSSKVHPTLGMAGIRAAYIEALCHLVVRLNEGGEGGEERAGEVLPMTIEASFVIPETADAGEVVLKLYYDKIPLPPTLSGMTVVVIRQALKEYGAGLAGQQDNWRVGAPPYVRLQEEIDRVEVALEEVGR